MDDDEDFRALFFSEARELLDSLQEHLNALVDETGDDETVHAAFRAVHSVKGGAAAFGFDQLISFAHVFETVMDHLRDGRKELDDDLGQILLRAGDIMQQLVEVAEADSDEEIPGMQRLQQELEVLAGGDPDKSEAPAQDAAPAAPAPTEEAEAAEGEPEKAEQIWRIMPEPGFFEAGHDMIRLIRAAKSHGLMEVQVDGEVPPITEYNPAECPVGWELTFLTEASVADISGFFEVYGHVAQIEMIKGPGATAGGGGPDGETEEAPSEEKVSAAPAAPTDAEKPKKAPANEGAAAPQGNRNSETVKSLRVETGRIDRLVNLVGEMLITQAALAQHLHDGGGHEVNEMAHAVDTMNRQLRELQESVMAIRAQPVKSVFRRMPRVVRDLADTLGKQAKLTLEGEQTEVDATVIEELAEPLTHMLRNAMDHGLEGNDEREAAGKPRVGQIRLSAEHRGERVIITIEDDGRGVDRDRVLAKARDRGLVADGETPSPEEIDMLIFHPGFSTASEVSSVSGRGVGMDVVKKKITSLGGRCSLENEPGRGTRFVITLPLTLAVMDGMTVALGDQKYILPLSTVVEALNVSEANGKRLPDGSTLLERRGEYLRLISLRTALSLPDTGAGEQMAIVVDTETSGHVALTVDELIGQRQIVLKSLEANFHQVEGISGATILGDGQVALILDVPHLIHANAPQSKEMFH